MSQKYYFIKNAKKVFGICLLSWSLLATVNAQPAAKTETKTEKSTTTVTTIVSQGTTLTTNGTEAKKAEPEKPVYYELVQDNLKPDPDEFYVNSIFDIQGKPKTIARSQNKRAGDLYDSYVTCGIGDYIADGLRIEYIDPRLKEIIVVRDATKEYYVLTMSYGTATSRLARIKNYKPRG